VKMIQFFRKAEGLISGVLGKDLNIEYPKAVSASFRNLNPLIAEDVRLWVQYWIKHWV
jgi:hypothetical protein